jgi:ligand-binding sensor domain-containing protein
MMTLRRFSEALILIVVVTLSLAAQTNSWQFTGGPYYGAATTIVCNSNGVVFAGTQVGVFRSTDDGATWSWVTKSSGTFDVSALAVQGDGKVFMGVTSGKIYRSDDNGDTWSVASNGLPGNMITDLKCRGGDTLFAATDSAGIYRSTTNGDIWKNANTGLQNLYMNCLTVPKHGRMYAGTQCGTYYSADNGSTWDTVVGFGTERGSMVCANSTGTVFITNGATNKSTDNGASWTNISIEADTIYNAITHKPIIEYLIITWPTFWQCDSNGNFYTLDFRETNYNVINKSTNGGSSWSSTRLIRSGGTFISGQLMSFNTSAYDSAYIGIFNTMCFSPKGYVFLGSAKGGILRFSSADSSTWLRGTKSIAARSINCMLPKGNTILAMTEGGLFRSSNNGNEWACNNHYINMNNHSLDINPNGVLFMTNDAVYSSTDDGLSWGQCASPTNSMASIAISTNGNICISNGVLPYLDLSTDNGASWQMISSAACSTLVAGTNGNVYGLRNSSFYYSSDSLKIWKSLYITDYISFSYAATPMVQIFAEINNNYYCGTCNGIVLSTDKGATWNYYNQGLPEVIKVTYAESDGSSYSISGYPTITAITANTSGDVFVGSDHGVYCLVHGSNQWCALNQGFPASVSISSVVVDSLDYLYAGTADGMIFKTTMITTGIAGEKNTTPLTWNLQQNYPNPFNPSTKINYQLASKSYVSLKVYDVLGREIATLADGYQVAGKYETQWNGTRNASGIYFVTLRTSGYTKTMKMVLLK